MNSFSAQRFLNFFNRRIRFGALVLLSLCPALPALAQGQGDFFRGSWQLQTPEQGGLTLLLKSNGRAAYFWSDNTDRTVYQGEWSLQGETAVIEWADQSQHTIQRSALGFEVSYRGPADGGAYTVRAEQIPKEVLGQWAKPPTAGDELRSDRDQAKGFFGIWQVGEGKFVFVEDDRSAASVNAAGQDLRGAWARQGSELHIAWDSGHYSILRENERGYGYKQIEPGVLIEEDATEFSAAARTVQDNVPAEWLSAYKKEREGSSGAVVFASRSSAREFYRGTWIIQRGTQTYERIEVERFGGLTSNRKRQLDGSWRMDGQDVFMRWDDGIRSILNPLGRGFLLYEYVPGRPLDGVPTRIFPAAPTDASKLAEHLQSRQAVTRQVLELAKTAGLNLERKNAGWGRTFARWAWPFSEDDAVEGLDPMESAEQPGSQDPWWWLFWSESGESLPAGAEPAQAPQAEPKASTVAPKPSAPATKKDWYWPF